MGKEVGITEHILLVDDKTQKRQVGVINFKGHFLLGWSPDRAETIVIWKKTEAQ